MKLKTDKGIIKVSCLDYHNGKIYAYKDRKHVGTYNAGSVEIIMNERELPRGEI